MSTRYGSSNRRLHASRRLRPDLALCYGTRPQVVKIARLLPALRDRMTVLTVDTGQHYDDELRGAQYRDLGIPLPDIFLEVQPGHPVEQTAWMAAACTQVLLRQRPRAVVVVGDTNSTLACAIAAAQLSIPIIHVEAGLRSGQLGMAEERNRRAVDRMSAVLCAPSSAAANALRAEGLPGAIFQTGDIARDVLVEALGAAPQRGGVPGVPDTQYALATLHRAELTDDPAHLTAVMRALGAGRWPVVLPLHPRTRDALERAGLLDRIDPNVTFTPPLPYLDTLAAIRDAAVVITDSGGVQREAYWLGTPCVTLRTETEWVETVSCGANRLVAPSRVSTELEPAVARAVAVERDWARDAYGRGDAGARIADAAEACLGARRSGRPGVLTP